MARIVMIMSVALILFACEDNTFTLGNPDGDSSTDGDFDSPASDGDWDGIDISESDETYEEPPYVDPKSVVVYYEHDPADPWSFGPMYAVAARNLLGHFATDVEIREMDGYEAGDLTDFEAAVYIGTVWDFEIPDAFLFDLMNTGVSVYWMGLHIEQLLEHPGLDAVNDLGFEYDTYVESERYDYVVYKGMDVSREADDSYFSAVELTGSGDAEVVAYLENDENQRPYLIKSGSFWYQGVIPFSYMANDTLIFADVLHDLLETQQYLPPRALVRLEDITVGNVDAAKLKSIADTLDGMNVPFAVGVIPTYADPEGEWFEPGTIMNMADYQAFIELMAYVVQHGGTLILHGWTHQDEGVTGVDYEFWDEKSNSPIGGDSWEWATGRIDNGLNEFERAMGWEPSIWETPHYAASYLDYFAIASRFETIFERLTIFNSLETLSADDQLYSSDTANATMITPYVLHDTQYGCRVIPENLGYIDTQNDDAYGVPQTGNGKAQNAEQFSVVRDPVVAFYFHHWQPHEELYSAIEQIRDLGFEFVSVRDILHEGFPQYE